MTTSKRKEEAEKAHAERAAAMKIRAAEYRKAQYQKMKERAKELKGKSRSIARASAATYPEDIQAALDYFAQNGFPMPEGPDADIVSEAKKKLSRVFHPDKGGTQDEITELNRHSEALSR